jgi:hypothetical protein
MASKYGRFAIMDTFMIGCTFQGLRVCCSVVFLILLVLLRNGDAAFSRSLGLGVVGHSPSHLAYSGIGPSFRAF